MDRPGRARSFGNPVIDATQAVISIHQNHERTFTALGIQPPEGKDDIRSGQEAIRNRELVEDRSHLFTLHDATWLLTPSRLVPAAKRHHLRRRWEVLPILHPRLRVPVQWLNRVRSILHQVFSITIRCANRVLGKRN